MRRGALKPLYFLYSCAFTYSMRARSFLFAVVEFRIVADVESELSFDQSRRRVGGAERAATVALTHTVARRITTVEQI